MQEFDYRSIVRTENRLRQTEREMERAERIDERLGCSGPQTSNLSEAVGKAGTTADAAENALEFAEDTDVNRGVKSVAKRAGFAATLGEAALSTHAELQHECSADLDVIIAGKLSRIGSVAGVTTGTTLAFSETTVAAPVIGATAGYKFDEEFGDKIEESARSAYTAFTDFLMNPLEPVEEFFEDLHEYMLGEDMSPK